MASSTSRHLIVEARKRGGLTQVELAERLGTHQPVIARWESGATNPTFESVRRAVRASGFQLGITMTPLDDHDLTLVRREMELLPHERLSGMVKAVNTLSAMNDARDRV